MSPVMNAWLGLNAFLHARHAPPPASAGRSRARSDRTERASNELGDAVQRWRRYSVARRALENLPPQDLADIGVRRGDIHRLAREAARR